MNENIEFKWLVLIYLLFAFSIGFLLAKTIYDDRPITKEELNELEKTEWYEWILIPIKIIIKTILYNIIKLNPILYYFWVQKFTLAIRRTMKPKNTYLVAIKLDKTKRNIYATISEVLTHDFIGVFSIAKQENIQFRDLLKINPENYFLENLNPIKIYEAKLDKLENEDYLNRLTNSIDLWEENGKNKIKLIEKNLGSGDDKRFSYSIIKESKFHGKSISSFLFSDKSDFIALGYKEGLVLLDDDFIYFSKIIYTEDLSPHLILNFGSYINIMVNKGLRAMTPEEISNFNARKKLSEIVEEEYGFKWDVDDETDLKYFIDIVYDINLQDRINENSYNKWLNYKNLIGLDDWEFYKFFDIKDFILFFLSLIELFFQHVNKIIKFFIWSYFSMIL